MAADFDFSCIPCAGLLCFRRPVPERKGCARTPTRCTGHGFDCRCCDECRKQCAALDAALEKLNGPG